MAASPIPMPSPPAHVALVVRALPTVTPSERQKILEEVEYNVFAFPAGLLTCDFLSDSGTSAMTDVQWAALMRGDESYGRNWGYYCLLDAFRDVFERGGHQQRAVERILTGTADVEFYRSKLLAEAEGGFVNGGPRQLERPNFFIVPQGRCAERLLFEAMSSATAEGQSQGGKAPTVISNGFFDTTAANAASAGFRLEVFTQPGLADPFPQELIGQSNGFKGNLDLAATEAFLDDNPGQVTMILMTITNNWAAAQPVSMANIRGAAALAKREDIALFFDACRFAENAYFIQRYEDGYAKRSIEDIVQEMFAYADGFTISLKKDGLANMGGVLCFRDRGVFATRYEGIGMRIKEQQIVCYGNDSYGGMSGRDLMAGSAGLYQVTKQAYLHNRVSQIQSFAQKLLASGIAVLSPPGGHAVYLDMDEFFLGCNRTPTEFASVGFTLELIKDFGIRACEAGPFGWAYDLKSPEERAKIPNLVRFAVPRNVYLGEHIDYTVAAIKAVHERRHTVPGVVITRGKSMRLRHFSAGLRPVPVDPTIMGTIFAEATKQLGHLSLVVEHDAAAKEELIRALALATGEWGRTPVPSLKRVDPAVVAAAWVSRVGNDGSPIEYSVAVDQSTGEAELRFMVEAQPHEGRSSWEHLCSAALQLTKDIATAYPADVSLRRLDLIRDLFLPAQLPSAMHKFKMAAWHSFAWSGKKGPQWKIYLDPCVGDDPVSTTRQAFTRLGLEPAWRQLESILTPSDAIVYFSLDLSDAEDARVKVYITHDGADADATSSSLVAEIARKHATVGPHTDTFEMQRFIAAMFGPGPRQGNKKRLISCFAFTTAAPYATATIHFPIDSYVPSDAEARMRIEAYLSAVGASSRARERYARVAAAAQRRPLSHRPGMHAWVSLKQRAGGRRENTFYFCPEMGAGMDL